MKFLNVICTCILHLLGYRSSHWTCKLYMKSRCCFWSLFKCLLYVDTILSNFIIDWKYIFTRNCFEHINFREDQVFWKVVFNQHYSFRVSGTLKNISRNCSILFWIMKTFSREFRNFLWVVIYIFLAKVEIIQSLTVLLVVTKTNYKWQLRQYKKIIDSNILYKEAVLKNFEHIELRNTNMTLKKIFW